MLKEQVKSLLRQHACNQQIDFKATLKSCINYLDPEDKVEILTQCAMLASRHGILSHLKILIEENIDILKEKQSGIFRIAAEIEKVEDFKAIINYLLEVDKKSLINVNSLDGDFLKQCIKREKLEYIQYLIEDKQVVFDINSNIIKTVLRNENHATLDYFVINLKIPVNIEQLTTWILDNNHTLALDKMNKCNMFIKLAQKLNNKNTIAKVKKI